nr:DUF2326 domain-containing protein [uncultured Cohaesibacter sp.]
MIINLTSSLDRFKTLKFHSGLNILVAERHETSGKRDTRNGTGKTSFVELVHYLLSETRTSKDDFHKPELIGNSFEATFRVSDKNFVVRKTPGNKKDEVYFNSSAIDPKDLRNKIATYWFGETLRSDEKYTPTFGSILAYFARKDRIGGFINPKTNSEKQKGWDWQVNLSYLINLDWTLSQRLQLKKDLRAQADTLAKIVQEGYFSDGVLDIAKMQTRLDLLEGEISSKRKEIQTATVVDGYSQHEQEANRLTREIRDLNEANLADLALVDDIDAALSEIDDANIADVRSLYEEVGIFFSDQVKQRFSQVQSFHKTIAANREKHLNSERRNAQGRLGRRKERINELQRRLARKIELLNSGVAVERYMLLQSELTTLDTEKADLEQQIPKVKNVAAQKKQLKTDIDNLLEDIETDLLERDGPRKLAVQAFGEVSKALYKEQGHLQLSRSQRDAGLVIDIDIPAKKSGGKGRMQIFCFDWMLASVAVTHGRSPGFLIHDSHVFDGVDGRQIGTALEFAAKKADELGIQYIVAMNSDDLQKIKNEENSSGDTIFDPVPYILPQRLADSEHGGLFGLRFD